MKWLVSPISNQFFPSKRGSGPTFGQGRASARAQAAFQHPSIATEILENSAAKLIGRSQESHRFFKNFATLWWSSNFFCSSESQHELMWWFGLVVWAFWEFYHLVMTNIAVEAMAHL